jgi:hypothetical protein
VVEGDCSGDEFAGERARRCYEGNPSGDREPSANPRNGLRDVISTRCLQIY